MKRTVEKTKLHRKLPHLGVYTRLRPSKIRKGGVGVFAIRNIKKGTNIFPDDTARLVWIHRNQLRGVPKELRQLYEDFPAIKDKGSLYGCPKSFNLLTVPWYINESKTNPNVVCDQSTYNFFTKRNIKAGEELTVNYDTYNEFR